MRWIRSNRMSGIVSAAMFACGVAVVAEAQQAAPSPEQAAAAQEAERARLAAMPDTPGTGLFPAIKEEVASLPDHVVYRPADLGKLGSTKLGLYLYGNGGCSNDGASQRLHLLEIASHGYLAIALGRIRSGPGATVAPTPAPAPAAADASRSAAVAAASRDRRQGADRGARLGARAERAIRRARTTAASIRPPSPSPASVAAGCRRCRWRRTRASRPWSS